MSSPVTVWRHHKNIRHYLHKKGKVIAWTKVFTAPAGFEHEAPYFVVMVEFEDKTRMPLQVADCDEDSLKPGRKIITTVRKRGKVGLEEVIEYGIKAKLL